MWQSSMTSVCLILQQEHLMTEHTQHVPRIWCHACICVQQGGKVNRVTSSRVLAAFMRAFMCSHAGSITSKVMYRRSWWKKCVICWQRPYAALSPGS